MQIEPAAHSEECAPEAPEFTCLFREQFRYVWTTLRRLGVFERDLEDMTHEVFLRVHGLLALYDPARPMRPWLFSIALGAASNYRRLAQHRFDLVAELPEVSQRGPLADERLAQKQEEGLVHEALQMVPLEQRAILVAHDIEGHSIPDLAAAFQLSPNTAYSRLRLGRDAFRAAVTRLQRRRGAT